MHEVLVNRLGSLSLPRKSVVRLTDRPDMTIDVYRGRKTTIQLQLVRMSCDSGKVSSKLRFQSTTLNQEFFDLAVRYPMTLLLIIMESRFIVFYMKNSIYKILVCVFLS